MIEDVEQHVCVLKGNDSSEDNFFHSTTFYCLLAVFILLFIIIITFSLKNLVKSVSTEEIAKTVLEPLPDKNLLALTER